MLTSSIKHYRVFDTIEKAAVLFSAYDMRTLRTSNKGNVHTVIGNYNDGTPAYFDVVCDGIYDYVTQNGYSNMGSWIEAAARAHNK